MKKALITGITGQDGSYLAELLLGKGYIIHGVIRRASSFNTERLDPMYKDPHRNDVHLFLHYGDLADSVVTSTLIAEIQPDEIFNLAAAKPCSRELRYSEIHRRARQRDDCINAAFQTDENAIAPG